MTTTILAALAALAGVIALGRRRRAGGRGQEPFRSAPWVLLTAIAAGLCALHLTVHLV